MPTNKKSKVSKPKVTDKDVEKYIEKKIKNFVNKIERSDCSKKYKNICSPGNGSIYGLGFIGSAIYYISTATSFWSGVLGILKSLVWPAFLVYELLKFLGI